jgi:hypothetical protein
MMLATWESSAVHQNRMQAKLMSASPLEPNPAMGGPIESECGSLVMDDEHGVSIDTHRFHKGI